MTVLFFLVQITFLMSVEIKELFYISLFYYLPEPFFQVFARVKIHILSLKISGNSPNILYFLTAETLENKIVVFAFF